MVFSISSTEKYDVVCFTLFVMSSVFLKKSFSTFHSNDMISRKNMGDKKWKILKKEKNKVFFLVSH